MARARLTKPNDFTLRIGLHERTCVIDAFGRLTVKVVLADVDLDGPFHTSEAPKLALATIIPPYCRLTDPPQKVSVTNGSGAGSPLSFAVERDVVVLGRGSNPTYTFWCQPHRQLRKARLEWSFRVSAAFPFQQIDLLYPLNNYWQNPGSIAHDRVLARSFVLSLPCEKLVLNFSFPHPVRCEGIHIEQKHENSFKVGHSWQQLNGHGIGGLKPEIKADGSISFTVPQPTPFCRYALSFQPPETYPRDTVQKALDLAGTLLQETRHQELGGHGLVQELNRAFHEALLGFAKTLLGKEKSKGTLADISFRGLLWSANDNDRRALQGFCGNAKSDHWVRTTDFGCGLAGHAFRLSSVISYCAADKNRLSNPDRDDQLLLVSNNEESQDWIIGVPLYFHDKGPPIGVVRLASRSNTGRHDLDKVLRGLAGNSRRTTEEYGENVAHLSWTVNLAFWQALYSSKHLPLPVKNRAAEVLLSFKGTERLEVRATPVPASGKPRDSASTAIDQPPAASSRPKKRGGRSALKKAPSVFLGHGHDASWMAVRSYLQDEHGLDVRVWEAQSRVGRNPKEFLRDELERCVFAVMVVTADDTTPDGQRRGRQNVIHETGLFQSKLGFEKVALIVEEGVEGCSNLVGIEVITFKSRKIAQAFHALSEMLRREGLVAL